MSRDQKLMVEWTKHLMVPEERDEFSKSVVRSGAVLSRLKSLLIEQLESVERIETSQSAYDSPSWAYRQAHLNGVVEAYRRILQLLP